MFLWESTICGVIISEKHIQKTHACVASGSRPASPRKYPYPASPRKSQSISIMAAVLSEIKCVNFGTLKSTWRVSKSQDVINVERDVFVRVIPTSTCLVGLICEQNQHAPSPLPHNFTLTKAVGLPSFDKAEKHNSSTRAFPTS